MFSFCEQLAFVSVNKSQAKIISVTSFNLKIHFLCDQKSENPTGRNYR